jgi:NAD(P)-dependent dehydrogenase (short-subunit alcohol dehydrogenase family)
MPSFSLEGKVAIVTGGKRGIGRAIALVFAEAGADVVICGRTIQDGELMDVAEEIRKFGRRSLAVQTDITRKTDVDSLVQRTMDEFGRIDILINNAGVYMRAPILALQEDDWDRVMNTDLKGYFFCCQEVGKRMVDRKSGNIINIATTSAWEAAKEVGAYCIAKVGVVMLTRVLALELASSNVRVNAIAPFWVRTKMSEPWTGDPEVLKQVEAETPLGRIGEPNDIVGAALFLASGASNYITGQTIIVDGGWLA